MLSNIISIKILLIWTFFSLKALTRISHFYKFLNVFFYEKIFNIFLTEWYISTLLFCTLLVNLNVWSYVWSFYGYLLIFDWTFTIISYENDFYYNCQCVNVSLFYIWLFFFWLLNSNENQILIFHVLIKIFVVFLQINIFLQFSFIFRATHKMMFFKT